MGKLSQAASELKLMTDEEIEEMKCDALEMDEREYIEKHPAALQLIMGVLEFIIRIPLPFKWWKLVQIGCTILLSMFIRKYEIK